MKKNFVFGVVFSAIYWISGYITGVCRMSIKQADKEMEEIRKTDEELTKKEEELQKNLYAWGLKKKSEEETA